MPDNLNLPHLVQVCEAAVEANYNRCLDTQEYLRQLGPSTVLALLRRLMEAEERIDELQELSAFLSDPNYNSILPLERKAP